MKKTKHKSNYMFTNKKHPKRGIMSAVLGIISIISILLAVWLTFRKDGVAAFNYGLAILLATLFSLAGLWLGAASRTEKDCYYLFPCLGIGFNLLALAGISFILYAGAYGL